MKYTKPGKSDGLPYLHDCMGFGNTQRDNVVVRQTKLIREKL